MQLQRLRVFLKNTQPGFHLCKVLRCDARKIKSLGKLQGRKREKHPQYQRCQASETHLAVQMPS